MHILRRGHLYFGLFLFPWAILYGVTAFLFNHPAAFPDHATATFARDSLVGTPMEHGSSLEDQANEVIRLLNDIQKPETPYLRGPGEAQYATREFMFATVKADSTLINLLIDVNSHTGTIRETPKQVPQEKAPFATGKTSGVTKKSAKEEGTSNLQSGIRLADSLPIRFKQSIPTILERHGFPTGEVTVTSSPDLKFNVIANGQSWTALYNPVTNTVTGSTPEDRGTEISIRRFLLRLHTAHGYPGEANAKWFWAIIVDAMAFTMCFWGVTGLLMWFQIKSTRQIGLIILAISAIAAMSLGWLMYAMMTQ